MSKTDKEDKSEAKRERRERKEKRAREEPTEQVVGAENDAEPKQKKQKKSKSKSENTIDDAEIKAEPKEKKHKKSKSKSEDTTDATPQAKAPSTSDDFIAFSDVQGDASLAPKMTEDRSERITSISHGNKKANAHETAKATAVAMPGETPEERRARRKEHNAAAKKIKKERRAKRAMMKRNERKGKKEARAITAEEYGKTGEDVGDKTERRRFICFVGQLPHNTTVEKVKEHFSKIEPAGIRLPTDKETGKGKGYCFLEFDDFDRMKTCLKLYHHSNFADGTKKPRKINIELTAGGGGSKSEVRKLRLQMKNFKLAEQRKRRYKTEEEERANLEMQAAIKAKRKLKYNKNKERNEARKNGLAHEEIGAKAAGGPAPVQADGLHPARMAMLEKGGKR